MEVTRPQIERKVAEGRQLPCRYRHHEQPPDGAEGLPQVEIEHLVGVLLRPLGVLAEVTPPITTEQMAPPLSGEPDNVMVSLQTATLKRLGQPCKQLHGVFRPERIVEPHAPALVVMALPPKAAFAERWPNQ